MMGRISKQGMGVPEMWESRPNTGVLMPTDPKDIEIHNLRNALINFTFAMEEISRQRYANKCREIAQDALASLAKRMAAGAK